MKSNLARRAFVGAVLGSLLAAGCATAPVATAPKPKLVVLLVVDGLPQWQVTEYRDQFVPDGLNRFLQHGAWFADAHHVHAHTATGPGHATFLTGAAPHRTGIIGNEWRDPASGAMTYCAQDEAHTYLGHRTVKLDGTSPKNLLVESLGDVLKAADPRSKTIAISGKDRGAILPAGKAGTAFMYMKQTGQFASSTYYMKEHPAWVAAFNAAKPAERYFKASWKPLLPEIAYARSVPDGQAWFSRPGRLPRTMGERLDAPGPLFYDELHASPFIDALSLDFARAAIEGERLGEDDAPDILSVSLSGHDYVNHSWGAESRLSHDHLLQLDTLLAAFFRDLDQRLGRDHYVAVLTSDHGFTPATEYLKSRGVDAGRQRSAEVLAKLNAGLVKRFGEGAWVRGMSAHAVLLDNALIAQRGVDRPALEAEAKRLLLAEPSLVGAFTRSEILDPLTPDAPFLQSVRRTYYPGRSADIQVVLRPNWIFGSSNDGATHGAPHPSDTHVPLLAWGPRWIAPGRRDTRVGIIDIAPTLAKILGVRAPAASEGKLLPIGP